MENEKKQQANKKSLTLNSMPAGFAVVPCPLDKKDPKPVNTKCTFSKINVTKDDRKFEAEFDEKTGAGQRYLQVIAGQKQKPSEIKCKILDLKINCTQPKKYNHKNHVWDIEFSPKGQKTDEKLNFDVVANSYSFFSLGSTQPKNYDVDLNTCGESYSFRVDAFPDAKVALLFKLYDGDSKTTTWENSNYKAKYKKKYETKIVGFEVDYSYEHDGQKFDLDFKQFELFNKISKCLEIRKMLLGILQDGINRKGDDGKLIECDFASFEIKKTKIELGGEWYWEEIPHNRTCQFVKSITLEAHPFIGWEGVLNITNIAIAALSDGAAVKAIHFTKDLLNKIHAKAQIMQLLLKGQNEWGGKLNYNVPSSTPWSGQFTGKLVATLSLVIVEIELKYLFVELDVGFSINADASVEGTLSYSQTGSTVDLVIKFNGCNIYFLVKGEFKVENLSGGSDGEKKIPIIDEIGACILKEEQWLL